MASGPLPCNLPSAPFAISWQGLHPFQSDEAPEVDAQVKDQGFRARARTAAAGKRKRLWRAIAEVWTPYQEYGERSEREPRLVVLERCSPWTAAQAAEARRDRDARGRPDATPPTP
jgi:hypothetical protein